MSLPNLQVLREICATEVQRRSALDIDTIRLLCSEQPVVIPNAYLIDSAVSNWDLAFFEQHAGAEASFAVKASNGTFLYSDPSKNEGAYEWRDTVASREMGFADFAALLRAKILAEGREPFRTPEPGDADYTPEPCGPTPLYNLLFPEGSAAAAETLERIAHDAALAAASRALLQGTFGEERADLEGVAAAELLLGTYATGSGPGRAATAAVASALAGGGVSRVHGSGDGGSGDGGSGSSRGEWVTAVAANGRCGNCSSCRGSSGGDGAVAAAAGSSTADHEGAIVPRDSAAAGAAGAAAAGAAAGMGAAALVPAATAAAGSGGGSRGGNKKGGGKKKGGAEREKKAAKAAAAAAAASAAGGALVRWGGGGEGGTSSLSLPGVGLGGATECGFNSNDSERLPLHAGAYPPGAAAPYVALAAAAAAASIDAAAVAVVTSALVSEGDNTAAAARGLSAISAAAAAGAAPDPGAPTPPPAVDARVPRGPVPRTRLYLQQPMYAGLGPRVVQTFNEFNWPWLSGVERRAGWGALSGNLLLVGERGATTPFHYDEQQNLFAQVRGRKLVLLASPAEFGSLYPYPVGHPADRQSQVHLHSPDTARFPRFRALKLQYAVLRPGEVLYIPAFWWHHVEGTWEDTISLNFWFRCAPVKAPSVPIVDPGQLMALRRNIEKLTGQSVGYGASGAMWAKLAASQPLSPEEATTYGQIATLLGQVLGPGNLPAFIAELTHGRFDLPRRAAFSASASAVLSGLRDPPRAGAAGAGAATSTTAAGTGAGGGRGSGRAPVSLTAAGLRSLSALSPSGR